MGRANFQLRLLYNKITCADGVIISRPSTTNNHLTCAEECHRVALLRCASTFENKPVAIVGASYYDQGISRAGTSVQDYGCSGRKRVRFCLVTSLSFGRATGF